MASAITIHLFPVNFCEWYRIGVQFHSLTCEYLVFLTQFIEVSLPFKRVVLAPLSNTA